MRKIFFLVILVGLLLLPLISFHIVEAQTKYYGIGIASYGYYDYNGLIQPYSISTKEIVGFFNITSISGGSLLTLQLGATINYSGLYWIQESLVFNPGNQTLAFFANNSFLTPFTKYFLPLAGFLIIQLENNGDITVFKFGYIIIQNGSKIYPPELRSYESRVRGVYSFTVNPIGGNVEFVFGGFNSPAIFNSLTSSLSLFYNNSELTPFPSVFSYGLNSTGSAENLKSNIENNIVQVSIGQPNKVILTNNYTPPLPPLTYVNITYNVVNWKVYKTLTLYVNHGENLSIQKIIPINSSAYLYYNGSPLFQFINFTPHTFLMYNITLNYLLFYKILVNYPNGSSVVLNVERGSIIEFPQVINITSEERYYLNSSQDIKIVSYQSAITPIYVKQFLVKIYYPNGTYISWITQGKTIILPKVIYVNNFTRYVLLTNLSITVTSPISLEGIYTEQFLTIINYSGVVTKQWVDAGNIITLTANVPLFYNAYWKGTYNVPVGSKIVIDRPVQEELVEYLDVKEVAFIGLIITLAGFLTFFWLSVRKR